MSAKGNDHCSHRNKTQVNAIEERHLGKTEAVKKGTSRKHEKTRKISDRNKLKVNMIESERHGSALTMHLKTIRY